MGPNLLVSCSSWVLSSYRSSSMSNDPPPRATSTTSLSWSISMQAFQHPPFMGEKGSVLNVEMTAEARELTSFKIEPCELTQVTYLHISNTLHRMYKAALRTRPVVMPRHSVGRHAHRPAATGCRSPGSAWPTGPHSGHRPASAVRARVGTLGTRGGTGETPPGASGLRTPVDVPRMVAVVAHYPWCPFRLACSPCGQQPTESTPFSASPAAVVWTMGTGNARTCPLSSSIPPHTPWAPKMTACLKSDGRGRSISSHLSRVNTG